MNSRRMHVLLVSVLFACGAFGPKAQASVVLELIPDNTEPYFGGESLTVGVWLHNNDDLHHLLYHVQLDFRDSHPDLVLGPTFTFDLTSSTHPEDFQIQPDLPVPWADNTAEYDCDECRLQLPANGWLHVGDLTVQLPTDPAIYVLDALNRDDPPDGGDPLQYPGALMYVDARYFWQAYTGDITRGIFDFEVIPEPATLSLLMLGAAAVVCRRRRAR
jgi:hypothetical protein